MDICAEAKSRIEAAIPGADVEVTGGGGHFEIRVVSDAFAGKRTMPRQRMVYMAIKELMAGDAAPIHAVDRMVCETP
jgi:acid stress-induced BolA-like protein IbaG/YrbA